MKLRMLLRRDLRLILSTLNHVSTTIQENDLLESKEYDDCDSHGNQGDCYTNIPNDLQRECNPSGKLLSGCTQQYGKVGEVGAFTHCYRDIGEGINP